VAGRSCGGCAAGPEAKQGSTEEHARPWSLSVRRPSSWSLDSASPTASQAPVPCLSGDQAPGPSPAASSSRRAGPWRPATAPSARAGPPPSLPLPLRPPGFHPTAESGSRCLRRAAERLPRGAGQLGGASRTVVGGPTCRRQFT